MLSFHFQVNIVSAFIDGSQIYGANCEEAELIRDRKANLGLLRVIPFPGISTKSPILPKAGPELYCRSSNPTEKPCFHSGDYRRVNGNPGTYEKNFYYTVRPPFRGQPRDLRKCPLKFAWKYFSTFGNLRTSKEIFKK